MERFLIDPQTGEILPPFFRTGFNYDRDAASVAAGQLNLEPSLAQQQFAEEVDINTIVRKFGLTGQMPDNPRIPTYGDFTGVSDYQTALNAVRLAEESFMALPADVRAEFQNDPQQLLEAVEDPRNLDRLVELGLAVARPKPEPSPAPSPAPAPASGQSST